MYLLQNDLRLLFIPYTSDPYIFFLVQVESPFSDDFKFVQIDNNDLSVYTSTSYPRNYLIQLYIMHFLNQ